MNVLGELYEARQRRYKATPGSREWWRATRDVRAARKRLQATIAAIGEALRCFGRYAVNAFKSVAESLSELNGMLEDYKDA